MLPHDGGGMAEKGLDVSLIPVRRFRLADHAPQPLALDEVANRSCRRVAVVEAGRLELAVVDAPAVLEQTERFGRQLDHAQAGQRRSRQAGAERAEQQRRMAGYGPDFRPGDTPVTSDVVDPFELAADRELDG